jgi:hypothetical protein
VGEPERAPVGVVEAVLRAAVSVAADEQRDGDGDLGERDEQHRE